MKDITSKVPEYEENSVSVRTHEDIENAYFVSACCGTATECAVLDRDSLREFRDEIDVVLEEPTFTASEVRERVRQILTGIDEGLNDKSDIAYLKVLIRGAFELHPKPITIFKD